MANGQEKGLLAKMIDKVLRWSLLALVCCFGGPVAAAAASGTQCPPAAGAGAFEFRVGGNTLRGFLELPPGAARRPVLVIIPGANDTDVSRDAYFDDMKAAFRRAGVGTVIWDKAGNGCSDGKYSGILPNRERADEVLAAVATLKQHPRVDASRIGLWAHSQGGWVAPMAAVRSSDIAFMITVSGPGRDAVSQSHYLLINRLRASGVDGAEADQAGAVLRRGSAVIMAGGTFQEFLAVVEPLRKYPVFHEIGLFDEPGVGAMLDIRTNPEWAMSADVILNEIRLPILAIFGQRDTQVDWREGVEAYRNISLRAANKDVTVRTFEDADHNMFRSARAGQSREGEFVQGFLETMVDWLRARGFTDDKQ